MNASMLLGSIGMALTRAIILSTFPPDPQWGAGNRRSLEFQLAPVADGTPAIHRRSGGHRSFAPRMPRIAPPALRSLRHHRDVVSPHVRARSRARRQDYRHNVSP